MRLLTLSGMATILALTAPLAQAQQAKAPVPAAPPAAGPATSAGPGRITCATAQVCELGIGSPAKLKYQITIEALSAEDKDRLGKQCKPAGKVACVVTIDGTEMADPVKLKATKIKWHN